MKNLTDMINEGLIRENHTTLTAPRDEKELLSDKSAFEKELKESQRKQKDLERDLDKLEKQFSDEDEETRTKLDNLHRRMVLTQRYLIEREKAEQEYARLMIDSIDSIIKDLKA